MSFYIEFRLLMAMDENWRVMIRFLRCWVNHRFFPVHPADRDAHRGEVMPAPLRGKPETGPGNPRHRESPGLQPF